MNVNYPALRKGTSWHGELKKLFQSILFVIPLIIGFILMRGDILQKIIGVMFFVYVLIEIYSLFKKPIPFLLDIIQIIIVAFFAIFLFVNGIDYLFILVAGIIELWLIHSFFKDYIVLTDD